MILTENHITAAVVAVVVVMVGITARSLIIEGQEKAVDIAAAESTIAAIEAEQSRVSQQTQKAAVELRQLKGTLDNIQAASNRLESLMERNWHDELQTQHDFVHRADSASAAQLLRAQNALDEDIAPAGGL